MAIETIEAGRWLYAEGGVPEYFIYKLIRGRVSVYRGGTKIREVAVTEGEPPKILGVSALLRDSRQHMSSVKAETDLEVERTGVEQIRGVLAAEIPAAMKQDVALMVKSIVLGNELVGKRNEFLALPTVQLELPDGLPEEIKGVLSEVQRVYALVHGDVERLVGGGL